MELELFINVILQFKLPFTHKKRHPEFTECLLERYIARNMSFLYHSYAIEAPMPLSVILRLQEFQ